MKLNKIILSLLLICGLSYGETCWREYNGNKVAPIEYIVQEDPYNNEGKYYELFGKVIQRIDANSMLVHGTENPFYRGQRAIIYVEGIPKGTSVAEDSFIKLIVKGDGKYEYITGLRTQKVVIKAIWQKQDKIKEQLINRIVW